MQARSLARLQAVLTAIVFDHALRIRLVAEQADAGTSRSASPADSAAESDDATLRASTPQGKPDGPTQAAAGKTAASNLAGRLNNLVTSDLENIGAGREFLFVGGWRTCLLAILPF